MCGLTSLIDSLRKMGEIKNTAESGITSEAILSERTRDE
jgi:hypothetical protein